MPRRCVAAGCSTASGKGVTLHEFPHDDTTRLKWTRAVKRQHAGWKGPPSTSLLCAKHFEPESFETEGIHYRDALGLPAKKHLKPGTIPTIFQRSIHGGSSKPTTASQRPALERRKRKTVSQQLINISIITYIASYYMIQIATAI